MKKYEAHEYANLFPMMTPAELDALVVDVKDNGLRHPIVRYQGKILDGRNRLKACEVAGVEPTFVDHEGDDASALALVESLNVERRDLSSGQRAMVAAKRWRVNGNTKPGGKRVKGQITDSNLTVSGLAKKYKVGNTAILQCRDLLDQADDLVEQVAMGTMSPAEAFGKLAERQKEAADNERLADLIAEYRDDVSAGRMTQEEAIARARDAERQRKEKEEQTRQARQLWHNGLANQVRWVNDWVKKIKDDHLAWYTEPGEPGTETELTAEQIEQTIEQLKRVLAITFKRRK
jgi:ParB-like chromosome segregation protein Spo0J